MQFDSLVYFEKWGKIDDGENHLTKFSMILLFKNIF